MKDIAGTIPLKPERGEGLHGPGLPASPDGEAAVQRRPPLLVRETRMVFGAVGPQVDSLLSNDSEHNTFFCFLTSLQLCCKFEMVSKFYKIIKCNCLFSFFKSLNTRQRCRPSGNERNVMGGSQQTVMCSCLVVSALPG